MKKRILYKICIVALPLLVLIANSVIFYEISRWRSSAQRLVFYSMLRPANTEVKEFLNNRYTAADIKQIRDEYDNSWIFKIMYSASSIDADKLLKNLGQP